MYLPFSVCNTNVMGFIYFVYSFYIKIGSCFINNRWDLANSKDAIKWKDFLQFTLKHLLVVVLKYLFKEVVVADTGLTVALTNNWVQYSFLPLLGFSLCSSIPISYLLCSCLSLWHVCLIVYALCHKAAENPISHLLMASAFSLSYSTIMYQAQRAPTPSQ